MNSKVYTRILTVCIVLFSATLAWFAFIYYPKVTGDYKAGKIPTRSLVQTVSARNENVPAETSAYRITFENSSESYYIFVEGKTLDEFLVNRNSAQLALKTTLSLSKLCGINIIYSSVEHLTIPVEYQNPEDC